MSDETNDGDALGEVLERLHGVIEARRDGDTGRSYTAQLLADGLPRIAKKLGEEAMETVIAGAAGDAPATVRESADLLYHLLVLWAAAGITPDQVAAELARREGTSGLDEKAARGSKAGGR